MTEQQTLDRTQLTFKQAEGISPMPTALKRNELSDKLRAKSWRLQHFFFGESVERHYYAMINPWESILRDKHVNLDFKPVNKFSKGFYKIEKMYEDLFFQGSHADVLEYLQFVLRHRQCPSNFRKALELIFEECKAPWDIIFDGKKTTFYPKSNEIESQTIEEAYQTLKQESFGGGIKHLVSAVEEFKNGNNSDSIRESISAVESVVKKITKSPKATLPEGLKKLKSNGIKIHSALESALSKLYGYTSDEDGIRHSSSKIEDDADEIDAQYMLGSCAAFVSYLVRKSRKVGIETE